MTAAEASNALLQMLGRLLQSKRSALSKILRGAANPNTSVTQLVRRASGCGAGWAHRDLSPAGQRHRGADSVGLGVPDLRRRLHGAVVSLRLDQSGGYHASLLQGGPPAAAAAAAAGRRGPEVSEQETAAPPSLPPFPPPFFPPSLVTACLSLRFSQGLRGIVPAGSRAV